MCSFNVSNVQYGGEKSSFQPSLGLPALPAVKTVSQLEDEMKMLHLQKHKAVNIFFSFIKKFNNYKVNYSFYVPPFIRKMKKKYFVLKIYQI